MSQHSKVGGHSLGENNDKVGGRVCRDEYKKQVESFAGVSAPNLSEDCESD